MEPIVKIGTSFQIGAFVATVVAIEHDGVRVTLPNQKHRPLIPFSVAENAAMNQEAVAKDAWFQSHGNDWELNRFITIRPLSDL